PLQQSILVRQEASTLRHQDRLLQRLVAVDRHARDRAGRLIERRDRSLRLEGDRPFGDAELLRVDARSDRNGSFRDHHVDRRSLRRQARAIDGELLLAQVPIDQCREERAQYDRQQEDDPGSLHPSPLSPSPCFSSGQQPLPPAVTSSRKVTVRFTGRLVPTRLNSATYGTFTCVCTWTVRGAPAAGVG